MFQGEDVVSDGSLVVAGQDDDPRANGQGQIGRTPQPDPGDQEVGDPAETTDVVGEDADDVGEQRDETRVKRAQDAVGWGEFPSEGQCTTVVALRVSHARGDGAQRVSVGDQQRDVGTDRGGIQAKVHDAVSATLSADVVVGEKLSQGDVF